MEHHLDAFLRRGKLGYVVLGMRAPNVLLHGTILLLLYHNNILMVSRGFRDYLSGVGASELCWHEGGFKLTLKHLFLHGVPS